MKNNMKAIKILLIIIFSAYFSNAVSQWTQIGVQSGGRVSSISKSGNIFYASTFGYGMFKSEDNGNIWRKTAFFGIFINSIASKGSISIAGTTTGVYITTNSGQSWQQTSLNNFNVDGVNISSNRIFAGSVSQPTGIYYSSNNGTNWIQSTLNNRIINCIQSKGNKIVAGTNTAGVYISTDEGNTWNQTSLNNNTVRSIHIDENKIIAGTSYDGIYKSTNDGVSWVKTYNQPGVIYSISCENDTIFASSSLSGLLLSTNSGDSWINTGIGDNSNTFVFKTGNNVFTSWGNYGLQRSTNSGINFSTSDFPGGDALKFAASANKLYSAGSSGIYKSLNGGINWAQTNMKLYMSNIVISGGNLFSSGDGVGIHKSTDEGETWFEIPSPNSNKGIFSSVANANFIFASPYEQGVHRTSNDGINWTKVLNIPTANELVISGDTIFAGDAASGGIWISTNLGDNWVNVLPGKSINNIKISGNELYAATMTGVYYSSDRGINWQSIGLTSVNVNGVEKEFNKLICATKTGIFVTTNNGQNWISKNEGLFTNSEALSVFLSNGMLYTGIKNNSIWKRQLSELLAISKLSEEVPNDFNLEQNYPNPFNAMTTIRFNIPQLSSNQRTSGNLIQLKVFDIVGRELATLHNGYLLPGKYEVSFNASVYSSGIYFYQLRAGDFVQTKKLVLLK